jgi:hypothetical protein
MARFTLAGSIWALAFVVYLLTAATFLHGVARDTHLGEARLIMSLAQQTDWRSAPFRVWGRGTYHLLLSSVNHDENFVGRVFDGKIEVKITAPDDRPILNQIYDAAIRHGVPSNYTDSRLAGLDLEDWPHKTWTLHARVLTADDDFQTTRSELKLRKQGEELGMGGLMNYAMMFPAGIAWLIALMSALALAKTGRRWPLLVTLIAVIPVVVILSI